MQDERESELVPGSEFVVGRVADRSNASNYYIEENDGKGRRKQQAKVVIERLKREGIDLNHNRFLILQVPAPAQLFWPAPVRQPPCVAARLVTRALAHGQRI